MQAKSSYDNQDYVDVIDIEDEDHSFAAFFIGMKTGPSPYVKRPLVCSKSLYISITQWNFYIGQPLTNYGGIQWLRGHNFGLFLTTTYLYVDIVNLERGQK